MVSPSLNLPKHHAPLCSETHVNRAWLQTPEQVPNQGAVYPQKMINTSRTVIQSFKTRMPLTKSIMKSSMVYKAKPGDFARRKAGIFWWQWSDDINCYSWSPAIIHHYVKADMSC